LNYFRQFKRFLIYKIKKKINIDLEKNQKHLSINELFQYYKTDKADKWQNNLGHGFSKYYEKYFKNLKNKKINILEVGSFSGASAASFVKFLPFSKIYCLDINITNFKYHSKKIKVFGLDISKEKMVKKFFKKINISSETKFFDIIIDDGSHKLSDLIISLNTFYKNLKPGGLFVIEDFKHPNYYNHLNDCDELDIPKIINQIKNKKIFNSNILHKEVITDILSTVEFINTYRGLKADSDVAFLKKLD
jgi:predicted O-methyltransferase YrrM